MNLLKRPSAFSRSGLDDTELRQVVHDHEALLRGLTDASILITGATGWFGTWILDVLCVADDVLRLGIRIVAVSRRPQVFLSRHRAFEGDGRISWIEADVRRLDAKCGSFSYVIHAATDSSSASVPLSPQQQFETIIEGTRSAIAVASLGCKGMLLLSSGAIYGPARAETSGFSESVNGGPDPASIENVYAEGKRAAEQLGAIAASGNVPVRIARCFAFAGPHMPFDRHFAIGNFIADAVGGRPILVESDGLSLRSYLYMTDLVVALLLILLNGAAGRAYNVGSEMPISIGELAHLVNRIAGGRGVTVKGNASDPSDRYIPDITRLRAELGFSPQVGLEAAIAKTAAWYREKVARSMSS